MCDAPRPIVEASPGLARRLGLVVESSGESSLGLDDLLSDEDRGALGDTIEACRNARFDLVLMDVHMPRIDGHEVAPAIVDEHGDRAPWIIALTADVVGLSRAECTDAGMDGFLEKPSRMETLLDLLRETEERSSHVA